jgi:hypothetical protein
MDSYDNEEMSWVEPHESEVNELIYECACIHNLPPQIE